MPASGWCSNVRSATRQKSYRFEPSEKRWLDPAWRGGSRGPAALPRREGPAGEARRRSPERGRPQEDRPRPACGEADGGPEADEEEGSVRVRVADREVQAPVYVERGRVGPEAEPELGRDREARE